MSDPVKTCRRKWRYGSEQDAKKHIRGGMRKYLHAYGPCSVCGGYHIGHTRWAPPVTPESCNDATELTE